MSIVLIQIFNWKIYSFHFTPSLNTKGELSVNVLSFTPKIRINIIFNTYSNLDFEDQVNFSNIACDQEDPELEVKVDYCASTARRVYRWASFILYLL